MAARRRRPPCAAARAALTAPGAAAATATAATACAVAACAVAATGAARSGTAAAAALCCSGSRSGRRCGHSACCGDAGSSGVFDGQRSRARSRLGFGLWLRRGLGLRFGFLCARLGLRLWLGFGFGGRWRGGLRSGRLISRAGGSLSLIAQRQGFGRDELRHDDVFGRLDGGLVREPVVERPQPSRVQQQHAKDGGGVGGVVRGAGRSGCGWMQGGCHLAGKRGKPRGWRLICEKLPKLLPTDGPQRGAGDEQWGGDDAQQPKQGVHAGAPCSGALAGRRTRSSGWGQGRGVMAGCIAIDSQTERIVNAISSQLQGALLRRAIRSCKRSRMSMFLLIYSFF